MSILDICMPAALMAAPIAPQDWLDGYAVPRGKTSILAIQSASGKTTAVLTAIVRAATSGIFRLFGTRYHDRPLRCVLISGEETYDDIIRKLRVDHPDLVPAISKAVEDGNLVIICLKEIIGRGGVTDRLFAQDGAATDSYHVIASALRSVRPDFVFVDTLNSVSRSEYLDSQSPYATILELDRLAKELNAAIMISTHVTKEGTSKLEINEQTSAEAILSSMRGSGQLVSAARCVIVLAKASPSAFSAIPMKEGDVKFAAVIKTNLPHPDVLKVIPCIRSRAQKTFMTTFEDEETGAAQTLQAMSTAGYARIMQSLPAALHRLIQAAALSRSPFTETGKFSIAELRTSTLAGILPEGTEAHHVQKALDEMEERGEIVKARVSRTGSVYDVKGGPFANGFDENGKPVKVRAGEPIREMLIDAASAVTEAELRTIVASHMDRLTMPAQDRQPTPTKADADDHAAPARDHAPAQPAAPAAEDEHAPAEAMATDLGEDDLAALQADHPMTMEAPAMVTDAAEAAFSEIEAPAPAAAPAPADDGLEDLPF